MAKIIPINPNRLQINGEWYVKEGATQEHNTTPDNEFNEKQLTHSKQLTYETENFCIEATIITDEDDEPKYKEKDTYIEFTDKRKGFGYWVEDHWDNPEFLRALFHNYKTSLNEVHHLFNKEDLPVIQTFIGKLIEKKWL